MSAIHEVLSDRDPCEWCKVLKRCGSRCGCVNNDRVRKRIVVFELLHDARGLRIFLADCDVHADRALSFRFVFLVDDRVDRDGRLSCRAIADDEFALAAANWDHRVNGFDAGLERDGDPLTINDSVGFALDWHHCRVLKRALAVDWFTEDVYDAAEEFFAGWDG